jgi:uncharacterized protein (DUF1501 family)
MKEPTLQTRREFLQKGATVAAVTMTVPSFLTRTAYALNDPLDVKPAARAADEPILVVLQLAGGNDGLNTIVPYANDEYYRARRQLAIPKEQLLKINDAVGMNPELAPLKALYDEGHVAIVQGVGYPNPDRSHFKSMEIWETASGSERVEKYGWIGRYFDNACKGEPEPTVGVSIGGQAPLTFRNSRSLGVAVANPQGYQWSPGPGMMANAEEKKKLFAELNTPQKQAPKGLDFLQRTALNAQVSSAKIREAINSYRSTAEYPPNGALGQGLRMIAAMIASNLGSRVYYASLGGFDTHSAQRPAHTNLLIQLAGAMRAFYQDLRTQGNADRVLVMTFSEFGRRVGENASGGTDHGTAAPMFLFGDMVKPGLYGEHPSLTDLDRGDLKFTVDFRSVYATVLEKWLKADARPVLSGAFSPLAFL